MIRNTTFGLLAAALNLGVALAMAPAAFAQDAAITIGAGIFPESIASTTQGDLLISSIVLGTVYRVPAGASAAEPWITGIGPAVTGVFALGDTAYVCSNGDFGSNQATLKTYTLADAQETGSYDFPDGGFCSDIAVAPDGTVYVAHLQFAEGQPGRILRLTDAGLEVVLADPAIRGIDGLAFLGDTLIGNDLFTGALYRIELGSEPATYSVLETSQPLLGPDGMRTTEDGTALLIAEAQGNRIVSVTVDGDKAEVTELASGLDGGPTGVAQVGDTVYAVEGYFAAMQGDTSRPAPDVFTVRSFPLL